MPFRTRMYRVVAIVGGLVITAVFGYRIALARTVAVQRQDVAIIHGICYHTDPSDYHCPDSMARFASRGADFIKEAYISVTDKQGKEYKTILPPNADAVFLSRAAMENFLLRHYRATNAKKAEALRVYIRTHSTPAATR
ncbi:MAG TPA: hypothetical protein VFT29_09205 [Gemmatimonadaceae bacterium]|nr:hypothetical protein [Gemmatimonadaceae bacterium]